MPIKTGTLLYIESALTVFGAFCRGPEVAQTRSVPPTAIFRVLYRRLLPVPDFEVSRLIFAIVCPSRRVGVNQEEKK